MFVSLLAYAESFGPGTGYLIILTVSGLVFLAMNLLSLGSEGGHGPDMTGDADMAGVPEVSDMPDASAATDVTDMPDTADVRVFDDSNQDTGELEAGTVSLFQYLSFRNCLNYLMGFGAGGYLSTLAGAHPAVTALCALSGGGVAAILLYKFMAALYSLGENQPLRRRDALGMTARVYIAIGPSRSRRGKILVQLKGAQRECLAVTDHPAELPLNSMVRITRVEDAVYIVEPVSP